MGGRKGERELEGEKSKTRGVEKAQACRLGRSGELGLLGMKLVTEATERLEGNR